MKFLILADNYHPLPLANSVCLRSLVDRFQTAGHQCIVINRVDDGVKVKDIEGVRSFNCSKSPKLGFLIQKLYKIKQLFVYPHVYKRLVNCYYEQIKQVDLSEIDVFLSICNPIEGVLAALKFSDIHPQIRHLVYNIDTLSDFRIRWIEGLCCPFWRYKAYKMEQMIFEKVDLVVFLSSHKCFYSVLKYSVYSHKFLFQEVPLLQVSEEENIENNGRCLYAGRFYKDFREPGILLNLFKNTSLGLDVFTTSNYCKIIKDGGVPGQLLFGLAADQQAKAQHCRQQCSGHAGDAALHTVWLSFAAVKAVCSSCKCASRSANIQLRFAGVTTALSGMVTCACRIRSSRVSTSLSRKFASTSAGG